MDTPDAPSPQPKIIVDEDWKSRVEAEREAGAKQPPPASSAPADELPMPDASFSVLVTTLATQAMLALGQAPMPDQQQETVNLPFAKHCIDTLAILADKTKGNLTSAEDHLLSRFLYELRLLFVGVQKQVPPRGTSSPEA
ncbi:MAG: DUF1844 domain-containing protein [Pirellulaceae bacterium]|jgi:hypothetical protein|nr:DUF1844 domain-containing protein [Pirellulaceae bacterium]